MEEKDKSWGRSDEQIIKNPLKKYLWEKNFKRII